MQAFKWVWRAQPYVHSLGRAAIRATPHVCGTVVGTRRPELAPGMPRPSGRHSSAVLRHAVLALALTAAGGLIPAQSLGAQLVRAGSGATASSAKGFFLGVHLNGSSISSDDLGDETESGGGLGFQLGYGFTPRLALFAEGTGALLNVEGDDVGLGHFDLGLRYAWTGERRLVPHLEAAVSGRALQQQDVVIDGEQGDLELSGVGATFGAGVQYFVSPKFSLGATFKYSVGALDTVKFGDVSVSDVDVDANTGRLNLGFTWYPRGGR